MDNTLQESLKEWQLATKPEDIFGNLGGVLDLSKQDDLLKQKFQELSSIADAEIYTDLPDKEAAESAKQILEKYHAEAKQLIAVGGYDAGRHAVPSGQTGMIKFQTERAEYILGEAFAEGDYCTLHEGELLIGSEAVKVAIKITNESSNNSMILREARAYKHFYDDKAPQHKHLPLLLDQFQTQDNRSGLIFRYLDNCYDLYTIREDSRYQNGVSRKHVVWVLNRVLSALSYVHSLGRLHGNIDPSHLMMRPQDHNVYLVGWGHTVFEPKATNEKFTVFNPEFSAPEVRENNIILPAADIYSVGMCMIYLLGGDIKKKIVPDDVEEELARFLGSMVMESPLQRQQKARILHGELDILVKELWGPKKFLVFDF